MVKICSIVCVFAMVMAIGQCGKMKSVGKWLNQAGIVRTQPPPQRPVFIVMSPNRSPMATSANQFNAIAILRNGNATGTLTFSQRIASEPVTITGKSSDHFRLNLN